MPGFLRCLSAAAALLTVLAGARSANAAPARMLVAPARPIVVRVWRPVGTAMFRGVVAPTIAVGVWHAFTPTHASPLGVTGQHQPIRGFSAFLPRLAWEVVAGHAFRGCRNAREPVRIAVLPRTPGFADGCAPRSLSELPPTSLVAGHNKNALYGRAYSPGSDDQR